jgi:serine/threonine protein kinase
LHELFPLTTDRNISPVYTSPEVLEGEDASAPSDVWGLGVILYLMVSGKLPWSGSPLVKLIDQICRSPFASVPQASPMLMDLLGLLLEKDPGQRVAIQDVLDHPWVAGRDAGRLFDDAFVRFESQIRDRGIDIPLIQELASQCGMQWQQLKEALITKRYDADTAIYRIRRRPRALAIYREPREFEEMPQIVSFAVAPPVGRPRGILEQDGWRSRLRKDLVRCNSNQPGPKVVQPAIKKN